MGWKDVRIFFLKNIEKMDFGQNRTKIGERRFGEMENRPS
jgi:hypothetical protein